MKFLILVAVLIGLASAQRRDSRCPQNQNGRNQVNLPHPTDCGRFLKCHLGNAYEVSCPNGQHWNAARNFCDSIQNAGCVSTMPVPRPQPPQPPVRPQVPLPPIRPQTPNPRPEIEHPDFLNCPQNDTPGKVVFYPYHLNCFMFYQCVTGRAVL